MPAVPEIAAAHGDARLVQILRALGDSVLNGLELRGGVVPAAGGGGVVRVAEVVLVVPDGALGEGPGIVVRQVFDFAGDEVVGG